MCRHYLRQLHNELQVGSTHLITGRYDKVAVLVLLGTSLLSIRVNSASQRVCKLDGRAVTEAQLVLIMPAL